MEKENLGPGYMGWKMTDNHGKIHDDSGYEEQMAEIKIAYSAMKKEFDDIKSEFN